jgi:hypothetical protein
MTEAESRGAISAAIDAGSRVLGTLPGQFLALCVLNALFISALLWFLAHQGDARERVIQSIVTSCMEQTRGK